MKILNVQRVEIDTEAIFVDKTYHYEVALNIGALSPEDIGAELVIAQQIEAGGKVNVVATKPLELTNVTGHEVVLSVDYTPDRTGTFDVAIRVYPKNERLPHRMDFALVKWA